MRRRAVIEPVIGPLKGDHRMSHNYLKGRDGDPINAVLAAVGLQLQPAPSLVREAFTRTVADPLPRRLGAPPHLTRRFETFFTADSLVCG
jgi:hypothetical protein